MAGGAPNTAGAVVASLGDDDLPAAVARAWIGAVKVLARRIEDGRGIVDCAIWGENQNGELSAKGTAEVELPLS